jgi:hypothetical protein
MLRALVSDYTADPAGSDDEDVLHAGCGR